MSTAASWHAPTCGSKSSVASMTTKVQCLAKMVSSALADPYQVVTGDTDQRRFRVVFDHFPERSGALLATFPFGELLAGHQGRQHRVSNDLRGDDHLRDVVATRNVVHDIEQHLFEDRPETPSPSATQQCKIGN